MKETGVYYLGTGCTPAYKLLEVLKITDEYIWQRYIADGGGDVLSRTYYKGTWYDWQ